MKVFTVNGPKLANVIFAFACTSVIVYFGFVSDNTIVVTATSQPSIPVAMVIEGFGYGQIGTREFMYIDIPFTAVVDSAAPQAVEDTYHLIVAGREVVSNIAEIGLSGINITSENSLKDAIEKSQENGFVLIFAQLSIDIAQEINNILYNEEHINFVTVSQLKEIIGGN